MTQDTQSAFFLLPLPGGRVARVPLSELEKFVDPALELSHTSDNLAAVSASASEDATAHHLGADATTGASIWHTDFELGPCSYTDEAGFPQYSLQWHRHPTGSEYAEVYR